jgi:hypothetical protein
MSAIQVAAELIRRAVDDENYAQELQDSANVDEAVFDELVYASITAADIGWLKPSEWLWFAFWRQAQGGQLDDHLLDHLEQALGSRATRFDLRGLVMRDRLTAEQAPQSDAQAPELESVGLRWLREHARRFPDSLEVARDALQLATEPAWFVLRVLTSLHDERAELVRSQVLRFAEQREISVEITARWFPSEEQGPQSTA